MNEEPKTLFRARLSEPRHLFFGIALLSLTLLVVMIIILSYGLSSQIPWFNGFAFLFAAIFVLSSVSCVLSFIPPVRWFFVMLWRKRLFVLAGIVTVIALFYAVENWRGWRAWQSYKQPRIAKGERFELAQYIPPAVPTEQNFFETPLWNDMHFTEGTNSQIIWTNPAWGKRVMFDVFGPKYPDLEVVTWTKGQRLDLGAWQQHYRGSNNVFAAASGAMTNYFPIAKKPQSPAEDVLLALSKFEENRKLLVESSSRPEARFWINYEAGWAALLPHLGRMRSATKYVALHAEAARVQHDNSTALADIQAGFRLIRAIRSEPIIVSHLVRIKMTEEILQPIWGGLANHQWTDPELQLLDARLQELDYLTDFEFSMRGERAFNLWLIDYIREGTSEEVSSMFSMMYEVKQRGEKGGEPINQVVMEALGGAVVKLAPRGWFEQNKRSICEVQDRYLFTLVDPTNRIVSPAAAKKAKEEFGRRPIRIFDAISPLVSPNVFDVPKSYARGQTMVDLARVALALERYRLANERFPENLDVLVPAFMDRVPHDIINGEPLKYHRTDDGQFILYSVGWNSTDDNGEVPTDKEPSEKLDAGDWVWKYAAGSASTF